MTCPYLHSHQEPQWGTDSHRSFQENLGKQGRFSTCRVIKLIGISFRCLEETQPDWVIMIVVFYGISWLFCPSIVYGFRARINHFAQPPMWKAEDLDVLPLCYSQ